MSAYRANRLCGPRVYTEGDWNFFPAITTRGLGRVFRNTRAEQELRQWFTPCNVYYVRSVTNEYEQTGRIIEII